MRFKETLQLQKHQVELQERQHEAQSRLEQVARRINSQFDYWCQFRNPFAESLIRIKQTQKDWMRSPNNVERRSTSPSQAPVDGEGSKSLDEDTSLGLGNTHFESGSINSIGTAEVIIRRQKDATEIDPTAFNLYRKLKYG